MTTAILCIATKMSCVSSQFIKDIYPRISNYSTVSLRLFLKENCLPCFVLFAFGEEGGNDLGWLAFLQQISVLDNKEDNLVLYPKISSSNQSRGYC